MRKRKYVRLDRKNYEQGSFWITICTQSKAPIFTNGYSKNENMFYLNELGLLVRDTLLKIPTKFIDVSLGEWVIMPDHIHAIIDIEKKNERNHLFDILQWIKSCSTRKSKIQKFWLRGFDERIIRNVAHRLYAERYIRNNPRKYILIDNL